MRILRRRLRLARYKKGHRQRSQRFRQHIFERDRKLELVRHPLPKVVILTGAGISAESGIKTFRAGDGLWEKHRVEDVATPEGFARDPALVQAFYNTRRRQLQQPDIQPNSAHLALAELETLLGDHLLIVTQNIDNLHERAGNSNVIHMHGELLKVRCSQSGQTQQWNGDLTPGDRCHCCQFPAPLRPHIVWFGEMPLHMDHIYQAIAEADYFLAIGTSGQVYPAAGFVHEARIQGAYTIEFNLAPSQISEEFDEKVYGPASKVVADWVTKFRQQRRH